MTVLLDTHVLIWWLDNSNRLSPRAIGILKNSENRILVSSAVAWELAIKVNAGKLRPPVSMDEFASAVEKQRFLALDISLDHAVRAGSLPLFHRDPFDRLLIAQAQTMDVAILSADSHLDRYDIARLW